MERDRAVAAEPGDELTGRFTLPVRTQRLTFEEWIDELDAYWELFGPPPPPSPKRAYRDVRL